MQRKMWFKLKKIWSFDLKKIPIYTNPACRSWSRSYLEAHGSWSRVSEESEHLGLKLIDLSLRLGVFDASLIISVCSCDANCKFNLPSYLCSHPDYSIYLSPILSKLHPSEVSLKCSAASCSINELPFGALALVHICSVYKKKTK